MTCPQCLASVSDEIDECPYCKASLSFVQSPTNSISFTVEKAISQKISEQQSGNLLNQMSEFDHVLAEKFATQMTFIQPDEILGMIAKFHNNQDAILDSGIKTILEQGLERLNFEGLSLNELMAGNQDIAPIVRTGITLLRNKKYAEAVEWWVLQKEQSVIPLQPKSELLYLLMEMFTYRLSGQIVKANELIQKIRLHSEFPKGK